MGEHHDGVDNSESVTVWCDTHIPDAPQNTDAPQCRELYRRTTLTEVQARDMTDEVLEGIMWETASTWEERWETLKVDENRLEEQEVDDEDKQARFWRNRP